MPEGESSSVFALLWEQGNAVEQNILQLAYRFRGVLKQHVGVDAQWPRGLRHELSWHTQTLGSWVRIPLKAWMSVCLFCV
jgi:hypothetical protein